MQFLLTQEYIGDKMIDNLLLFNWLVTIGIGIGGWALKEYTHGQAEKIKALKDQVDEMNVQLTAVKLDYLHKTDFREFKDELWARFDKLEKYLREA